MYVTVQYNKVLSSILYLFLTHQSEVDFGIVLVSEKTLWSSPLRHILILPRIIKQLPALYGI